MKEISNLDISKSSQDIDVLKITINENSEYVRLLYESFNDIDLDTFRGSVRGHHIYKYWWAPFKGQRFNCKPDSRTEVLTCDKYALRVYKRRNKDKKIR